MSETPSSSEPATGPVTTATAPPPQPPPAPPTYNERDREPRRGRLTAVAAWVGIVAGVVFIVAVIFFSGFILGAHSGGHRGGGDRDHGFMIQRGGPPPMFPMMPRGEFERPGPFGPGGPNFELPNGSNGPSTTPSRP